MSSLTVSIHRGDKLPTIDTISNQYSNRRHKQAIRKLKITSLGDRVTAGNVCMLYYDNFYIHVCCSLNFCLVVQWLS